MIKDLDATLEALLKQGAVAGSELAQANISFDIPDSDWRGGLEKLTVNCYLYDIRENRSMRTTEPLLQRSPDGARAARRQAPARIDCGYCITAWSAADDEKVLDEHRLLSQVLLVLLRHPTIPGQALQGSLVNQIPPYPTVIAAPDGIKNQPEFWGALDQQLKPSLSYAVTLAMMLDEPPAVLTDVVKEVEVIPDHWENRPVEGNE
jgi:hypothetical protein